MTDIFDVIADPTRRELLHALLARYVAADSETGEISVGDLVERLGLSQPTVSKHLRVLRDHGLVTVREDGQHRYYRLETAPLEEFDVWLQPYLLADVDDTFEPADGGAHAFAAWSGADVGETIGRRVAEGTHQARTAIHDAAGQVNRHLPRPFRRRPRRP